MDDYTPALLVARIKNLEAEIESLRSELDKLSIALVDIWKAFTPPATKREQIEALNLHERTLNKILERRNGG